MYRRREDRYDSPPRRHRDGAQPEPDYWIRNPHYPYEHDYWIRNPHYPYDRPEAPYYEAPPSRQPPPPPPPRAYAEWTTSARQTRGRGTRGGEHRPREDTRWDRRRSPEEERTGHGRRRRRSPASRASAERGRDQDTRPRKEGRRDTAGDDGRTDQDWRQRGPDATSSAATPRAPPPPPPTRTAAGTSAAAGAPQRTPSAHATAMEVLLEPPGRREAETLRDLVAYAVKRDAAELVTRYEIGPPETPEVMRQLLPLYCPANASPTLLAHFDAAIKTWIADIYDGLRHFYAEKVENCAQALKALGASDPTATWERAVRGFRRELGGTLPPAAVLDIILREDLGGFFQTPGEQGGEQDGRSNVPTAAADTATSATATTTNGATTATEAAPPTTTAPPGTTTTPTAAALSARWIVADPADLCRTITTYGAALAEETAATTTAAAAATATADAAPTTTPGANATGTPPPAPAARTATGPAQRIQTTALVFHQMAPTTRPAAAGASSSSPPEGAEDLPCGQKRGLPASASGVVPTAAQTTAFRLTPPTFLSTSASPCLFSPSSSSSPPQPPPPGDRPPTFILESDEETEEVAEVRDDSTTANQEQDEDWRRLVLDPVSPVPGPQSPLSAYHQKLQRTKSGAFAKNNWRLEPGRKVLILGDSNVQRLPPIRDSRVQVDSFPGATVYQATTIVAALTGTYPGVRRVVLSFGVCDKNSATPETFRRNLKALTETAQARFPAARVYVAKIAYNEARLSVTEQSRLMEFNAEIGRRPYYLASPAPEHVRTEVLWTPETAALVWDTWRIQLELPPIPHASAATDDTGCT